MNVICENCDYFQPNQDEPGSGWCRRNPPRGIDDKTNATAPIDPLDIWPPVADSAIEYCGQFKVKTSV